MMPFSLTDFSSVIIIFIVPLFTIWFLFRKVEFYVRKIPPGPIGLPLLGYIPFFSNEVHKDLFHLNEIYGKVCSITAGPVRVVITSDYDTAKELLSHPAALARMDHIMDIIPGKAGLGSMNGKQWIMERRCVLQALRNIGLGKELWDDIIREDVEMVLDCISKEKGRAMDVSEQLSNSAMNNMMALTLGRRFMNEIPKDVFDLIYQTIAAAKEQFQCFIILGAFPRLLRYLAKFDIGGYGTRFRKIESISEILRNEVTKQLKSEDDEDDSKNFIKQYADQVKNQNSQRNGDVSVEYLIGNIAVCLFASETSMAGIEWILYLMAALPKKQAKVHAEIDEIIGRNVTVSWEDRKNIPYSFACVLEMLRWAAVSPIFIPRRVTETFEFHGYSIPEGTMILANGWALNRDPKYWDHPDQFMPERFLNKNIENFSNLEGFAPFSFGKRNCPGERIATMIIYLYFVGIMQKFEVRTPSGKPPDLKPQFNGIFQAKNQELCFIERE